MTPENIHKLCDWVCDHVHATGTWPSEFVVFKKEEDGLNTWSIDKYLPILRTHAPAFVTTLNSHIQYQQMPTVKAAERALSELLRIRAEHIGDPERAHSEADSVLLQFLNDIGHKAITASYNDLIKDANWWGCA